MLTDNFELNLLNHFIDDCVSGQICLKALKRDTEPSDPPFEDNNFSPLPADNAVQAIITTYKFYCDCVNITSWETYVQPGGPMWMMAYNLKVTLHTLKILFGIKLLTVMD